MHICTRARTLAFINTRFADNNSSILLIVVGVIFFFFSRLVSTNLISQTVRIFHHSAIRKFRNSKVADSRIFELGTSRVRVTLGFRNFQTRKAVNKSRSSSRLMSGGFQLCLEVVNESFKISETRRIQKRRNSENRQSRSLFYKTEIRTRC